MKPVGRPEVRLYCHNPDCAHEDEAYKFGCVGGDDVVYTCPLCKGTAFPVKLPEGEVPVIKKVHNVKPVASEFNDEIKRNLDFIIVDFDRKSIKVIPESRVREEGDDVDIMLPMFTPEEVSKLSKKGYRNFNNDIQLMAEAVDRGEIPYNKEIQIWLREHGIAIAGEDEDEEVEDVGRVRDEIEEESAPFNEAGIGVYFSGFSAGIAYAQTPEFKKMVQDTITHKALPEVSEEDKNKAMELLSRVRTAATKIKNLTPLPTQK